MPQAAPVPPPAAAAPPKPKGAIGIWIGVLLIIGGIVLGIVLVVSGVKSFADGFYDLERVPINGGGVVRIDDTGTQSIYAERYTSSGATSFDTGPTFSGYGPDVAVRVIGPGGDEIAVRTSSSGETYVLNNREGVKIGEFDADVEGTYRIETRFQESNGRWNEIAVGQAIKLEGLGAIVGGIFGGGLVVLIGIIVVIVFAIRRSRSKKRIFEASNPYRGAYGAAPGWPAGPGYAPAGPGGYGAPPSAGSGTWAPPPAAGSGWVPPPVVDPAPSGGTWTPPPAPAPQEQGPGPAWQPPAAPPASPPPSWPGAEAPTAPATPPVDPLAPSWEPPAGDPPPASPSGGEPGSGS